MTDDLLTFDSKTKLNTCAQALSLGDGSVDTTNCVIKGVSVITSGVEAKGHDLAVDATTLKQLFKLATVMKTVPVKTNHGSGADAINGYLTQFRIEGDKLRADWHLMKTYNGTAHVLEMAERMPKDLGLSVAFRGDPEKKANGKKAARATELVSADLVTSPAANPDGLFSAVVDSAGGDMAKETTIQGAPGASAAAGGADEQVPAWAKGLIDSVEEIKAFNAELQEALADGELEDGEVDDELGGDDDGEGEGELVGAGAGAGEGGATGFQRGDRLSRMEAAINSLAHEFSRRDQQAVEDMEETEFAALEAKVEQLTEFSTNALAENVALNELVKELRASGGGGKPVGPSATTMFSEGTTKAPLEGQTEFEARTSELLIEFQSKRPELTEFGAKAEAVKQAINEDPTRYEKHLQAQGVRK